MFIPLFILKFEIIFIFEIDESFKCNVYTLIHIKTKIIMFEIKC